MTTALGPKMRIAPLLVLAAATAGAYPAAAQDPLDDFQLRPGPSSTPEAQGPVTEGVPRPRAAPAPTPSPTPTPVPTIRPPVPIPAPVVVPTPTPAPSAKPPVKAAPTSAPAPTPNAAATPSQAPQTAASSVPAPLPNPPVIVTPTSAATSEPVTASPPLANSGGTNWWLWLVGGIVLLGGGAAAGFAFARRRATEGPRAVPEIERPLVPARSAAPTQPVAAQPAAPQPAAAPLPAAPSPARAPDGEGLSLALEARQLSLTLTSAALAYRVTLTNNGKTRLTGVTVAGDMISAHSSLSEEEQLANAASELMQCHEIDSLAAGETTQVIGEFRLPFTRIRPIRKGKAALFVPLARLRVNAANGEHAAVLLTALVGQRSAQPGAGLQPFRLDYGPRIYREVTQRIFGQASRRAD